MSLSTLAVGQYFRLGLPGNARMKQTIEAYYNKTFHVTKIESGKVTVIDDRGTKRIFQKFGNRIRVGGVQLLGRTYIKKLPKNTRYQWLASKIQERR